MTSLDAFTMVATNPQDDANPVADKKLLLVITERDIVFNCPNCRGELVIDLAGSGLEIPCSHCGKTLTIPEYQPRPSGQGQGVTLRSTDSTETPPAPARHFDFFGQTREQLDRRLSELAHQLKENRSQDTEMRGHVNRATMELHRLQLRLKKLQERHGDIEAELAALRERITSSV